MNDQTGEQVVLGCVPVESEKIFGITWTPYAGSSMMQCSICQEKVWVGPEQQKKLADAQIWCFGCIIKENPEALKNIVQLSNKKTHWSLANEE